MALIETGDSSTGVANVDSNYNLKVALPSVKAQAGYVVVHLKYEGAFKKELIRVADLDFPEIRILTWEEVLNEINSK